MLLAIVASYLNGRTVCLSRSCKARGLAQSPKPGILHPCVEANPATARVWGSALRVFGLEVKGSQGFGVLAAALYGLVCFSVSRMAGRDFTGALCAS